MCRQCPVNGGRRVAVTVRPKKSSLDETAFVDNSGIYARRNFLNRNPDENHRTEIMRYNIARTAANSANLTAMRGGLGSPSIRYAMVVRRNAAQKSLKRVFFITVFW